MQHILAHNARNYGQDRSEAAFAAGVVNVAGHAHHLFYGSNLLLVESFRESDRELQIQVALVEWVVLNGHALPIYALPAVRLDDLSWLRVHLRAQPRTGMSAQNPAPSTSPLLAAKGPLAARRCGACSLQIYGVALLTLPAKSQVSGGRTAYCRIVAHAAGLKRGGTIVFCAQMVRS